MNRRKFLLLIGAAGLVAGCTPKSGGGETRKTLPWYRCTCGILFKGRNAKNNGETHVKEANDTNEKLHRAFRHHLERVKGH